MSDNETSKSILKLTNKEARDYFLKNESYCSFNLPPYINFGTLLKEVDKLLCDKCLKDYQHESPKYCSDPNYRILTNKDGKYAWRPMTLIHPAIYVSLVHEITKHEKWKCILKRFSNFPNSDNNENIECLSIPVQSQTDNTDTGEQIINWWEEIEQKSIELALDYEYLLQTDITDCYGSIYTHSIPWALHTEKLAKEGRDNKNLIGNLIDDNLKEMSYGQTNGIPQGSCLMDFIAEMVLGYADLELAEKLKKTGTTEYKILRYRDDYRIFVNNSQDGDNILKAISEILANLGMKLNASKTLTSDQVIKNSIKNDKLQWICKKQDEKDFQKHLLIIHEHARQFPNAGSLIGAIEQYHDRCLELVNKHEENPEEYSKEIDKIKRNLKPLISIAVDIAYHSPKVYMHVCLILSEMISMLATDKEKIKIIKRIILRFSKLPNTPYLLIWLQRISLRIKSEDIYENDICKLIMDFILFSRTDIEWILLERQSKKIEMIKSNERVKSLWNSEWLDQNDLKKLIDDPSQIVCKEEMGKLSPIMQKEEVNLFLYFFINN